MRAITAAVVSLSIGTLICAAPASADAKCDGSAGPNPATPESYQQHYNPSVAQPLTKEFAAYRSAVASGDLQQIGDAAATLHNDVVGDPNKFGTQDLFGCYSPAVLAGVQQAADALASTLDQISSAAAGDLPDLVSQAKPQVKAYIDALNAYASQFGGQQVPQS
jgi:LmbE family N-acetylglucosaminyl deacetylase